MLVVALLLAACGSDTDTETASSGGGDSYPQFTAATVDGAQLEFGSLEGRDTVLWFWAPW